MKAIFEITPSFKSIIEIREAYPQYYFAVLEEDDYTFLEPLHFYPDCSPRLAKVNKLVFRRYSWETMMIGDTMIHMPKYRFVRME